MGDAAWIPGAVTGTLALISVFVAGWLQSRRERKAADRASSRPTPPTTQEVWTRVDHLERVLRSAVFIIGELEEQWPEGFPQPVLPKRHVSVLSVEGYMPPEWDPAVE